MSTESIKATELSPVFHCHWNELADGTFLTWVSIQRERVYVKGVDSNGRIVRRRYRHNQLVEVAA